MNEKTLKEITKQLLWLIEENKLEIPEQFSSLKEEVQNLKGKSLEEALEIVSKSSMLRALALAVFE